MTGYFEKSPAPPKHCKLPHTKQEKKLQTELDHVLECRTDYVHLISRSLIPDPGVEVPLNKVLGSNSIPRLCFIDLRFLFEKPKEWPDSKGSFRFEDGVAITGVAEEKTGENHKRRNAFRWFVGLYLKPFWGWFWAKALRAVSVHL